MSRVATVRYGDHRCQSGVLRVPALRPGERAPVVVFLHGGFWSWPWGRWLVNLLGRDAVRRGWCSFEVGYRRLGALGGGGGWPSTFDDVRSAIESITAVDDSRVDPDRIVVVGHSAGGHLAHAVAPDLPPCVVAIVAIAAPNDLDRLADPHSSKVDALLAGAPREQRDTLSDPARTLPWGRRVVCVHSTADRVVSADHSVRFVAQALDRGDDAVLRLVGDDSHRVALWPRSATWRVAATEIDRTLAPATLDQGDTAISRSETARGTR